MLAQAGEEIRYVEAGVAVLAAAGRDDARSSEMAVDRRHKLGGQLGEVAADQGAKVAGLVAKLEHAVDLGDEGGVGFEEAFRRRVDLDATAGKIEKRVLASFVVERVGAARWH